MSGKIALKSGYYFKVFNKEIVNADLRITDTKVKFNNQIYRIYDGQTLDDVKRIDELFGDDMGYLIDDYEIKERKKPKCALIGQDGNIFNLMGIASRTLKDNNMRDEAKEMIEKVTSSNSYDEALYIIGEYVEITDEVGLEENEEEFEGGGDY